VTKSRYQTAIALDRLAGFERPRKGKKKPEKRRALDWMRPDRPSRVARDADVDATALRDAARREQPRVEREAPEPTLKPVAATRPDPWGPAVRMGRHLRVQAEVGHRAAVIELRPGLFLVAEVPEQVARPEFGVVPLLAPLLVKAASDALHLRRHPDDEEEAEFAPKPTPKALPCAPRALPGPVEEPASGGVPVLGWATERQVAEVLGCDACRGGRR
jgi:hypothetical protein